MARPLCILLTGTVPRKIIGQTGNFDAMFCRMADYSGLNIAIVPVAQGEQPAPPSAYCGVIVTGSPAMVTDKEPWSVACGRWLHNAWQDGCPILGVCYGHQLMAQAFGGAADYLPYPMEIGTHTVTMAPGADHPLLPQLPERFTANLVHSQTASILPPGATCLAAGDNDPHQILAYGPNAISTQFHPEFDLAVMEAYCALVLGPEAQEDAANAKGIRLGLPLEETPVATSILGHFVAYCRHAEMQRRKSA